MGNDDWKYANEDSQIIENVSSLFTDQNFSNWSQGNIQAIGSMFDSENPFKAFKAYLDFASEKGLDPSKLESQEQFEKDLKRFVSPKTKKEYIDARATKTVSGITGRFTTNAVATSKNTDPRPNYTSFQNAGFGTTDAYDGQQDAYADSMVGKAWGEADAAKNQAMGEISAAGQRGLAEMEWADREAKNKIREQQEKANKKIDENEQVYGQKLNDIYNEANTKADNIAGKSMSDATDLRNRADINVNAAKGEGRFGMINGKDYSTTLRLARQADAYNAAPRAHNISMWSGGQGGWNDMGTAYDKPELNTVEQRAIEESIALDKNQKELFQQFQHDVDELTVTAFQEWLKNKYNINLNEAEAKQKFNEMIYASRDTLNRDTTQSIYNLSATTAANKQNMSHTTASSQQNLASTTASNKQQMSNTVRQAQLQEVMVKNRYIFNKVYDRMFGAETAALLLDEQKVNSIFALSCATVMDPEIPTDLMYQADNELTIQLRDILRKQYPNKSDMEILQMAANMAESMHYDNLMKQAGTVDEQADIAQAAADVDAKNIVKDNKQDNKSDKKVDNAEKNNNKKKNK